MDVEYKSIEAVCPVCQVKKSINIPETVLSQKKFGTVKIQVPKGAVCPDHQFLIFVDTKGIIRGYEKIDIHLASASLSPEEANKDIQELNLKRILQLFGTYGAISLIHAKIFNFPSYIAVPEDLTKLEGVLNKVGNNLLPEKYQDTSDLAFLNKEEFSKFKPKKHKKALVLDETMNILQTPWDEKLKFEETIISKALEIIDEDEQIIILRQEIAKLIKESEYVTTILLNIKEIYEDDLIEQMARDLMISKISNYRLILIKQFIRQRINPDLPSKIKNKVEEFLNLL